MVDAKASPKRGDVYFISHGGPPTVEQYDSAPYKAWQRFGKMISSDPKPKGIVVVSAHWENGDSRPFKSSGVVVNSNTSNPLIYDFYNFPQRLYDLKFSSVAEPELQEKTIKALQDADIPVTREDRGPDHGVWIPFLAAFGPKSPLPIVQVSLPGTNDPLDSVRLGAALGKLREEGYAIVTTGQAVHNLRDLFSGRKMPYTRPFLDALETSISSADPVQSTVDLTKSPLYKSAHPTDEHYFPLLVALGALHKAEGDLQGSERKEDIFSGIISAAGFPSKDEGLGWGLWKWSRS